MFYRWSTVAAAVCLLSIIASLTAADQTIPYEDPAAAANYYPAGNYFFGQRQNFMSAPLVKT